MKPTTISKKAFDLIIHYEVGGGKGYYNKFLQRPVWPQGASGITIGIGYDLGYVDSQRFKDDWYGRIPEKDFNELYSFVGAKAAAARNFVKHVEHIKIPWEVALAVFEERTLPYFINQTIKAFPQSDKLHPDAFGALVSLVYNRGTAMGGERRREMRNIRDLVPKKDYKGIAREILSMKRLWVNKNMAGLLRRRTREAELVKNCE